MNRTNIKNKDITRLEIIDWTKDNKKGGGRVFTIWDEDIEIELSRQDDNRTLKIFITDRK